MQLVPSGSAVCVQVGLFDVSHVIEPTWHESLAGQLVPGTQVQTPALQFSSVPQDVPSARTPESVQTGSPLVGSHVMLAV